METNPAEYKQPGPLAGHFRYRVRDWRVVEVGRSGVRIELGRMNDAIQHCD